MTISDEMVERALTAYEGALLDLHSNQYENSEPISVSEIRSSCLRAALTAALQGSVVVPAPNDLAKLAARCENFKNGTKKLFEGGPTKGDMWFFELYHHLTDCAAALGKLPLPRHNLCSGSSDHGGDDVR